MRDYLLRVNQQRAAAAEAPCPRCPHPVSEHRELPPFTWALENGEFAEVQNPDYRSLHFHCALCPCVQVHDGLTGKALA